MKNITAMEAFSLCFKHTIKVQHSPAETMPETEQFMLFSRNYADLNKDMYLK